MDNMGLHFQCWYDLFWDLGLDMSMERVVQLTNGKTTDEIIREVLGEGLTPQQMDDYAERKEFLYRAIFRRRVKPLPGLRAFLRRVQRRGLLLALATSAGPRNIEFAMKALRLEEVFTIRVGGKDVAHGKPAPDLFLAAAARLGVEPAHCLVFEDSMMGLEAAQRAGMQAVALTTGFPPAELASAPNVIKVIKDYRDLDGFLNL